jgi:hypothetical protein
VSVSTVSQSVSGPRCILILHQHYPSPCRLIQSLFCLFRLSVYLPITLLLCSNSISVTDTVPTTTLLYILSLSTAPPCQSRLQPITALYQLLRHTHSLTVRACDEPAVSHPCLALHCNPTKSGTGYRRAHTLSRSLRDRQLAPAYYTPPPNLLGLATVQIEKSHIPPRQAVTHHLDASRLAP